MAVGCMRSHQAAGDRRHRSAFGRQFGAEQLDVRCGQYAFADGVGLYAKWGIEDKQIRGSARKELGIQRVR